MTVQTIMAAVDAKNSLGQSVRLILGESLLIESVICFCSECFDVYFCVLLGIILSIYSVFLYYPLSVYI